MRATVSGLLCTLALLGIVNIILLGELTDTAICDPPKHTS